MRIKINLIWLLLILTAITFALSPYLDQQLAVLPYNFQTHYFYGEISKWCKFIYYSVNVLTFILSIVPLLLFILVKKNKLALDPTLVKRMMLVTYLSLIIGPGLIVNTALKDGWGRPRPYQVIRDHKPFAYPWQPHLNHPKDNSFPSGHVSIGAMLGIPFIAMRRKKLGVGLCVAGTIIVGLVRYLQGGHYFSDIAMAAILVWMVTALITPLVDRYLNINESNYGS
jgi:lipid A 4'-phosphatase